MGCGTSFVKYVLFFANLIFALGGLAILGIGIAFQLQVTAVTDIFEGLVVSAPIVFIVFGSIVFIISFFGCCGAIRESHCMVVTYAVFLIVIIILQVVIAILLFVYLPSIDQNVLDAIEAAFDKAKPPGEVARQSFNTMEELLQCCGTTGANSYTEISLPLPTSCCSASPNPCTINNAWTIGCVPRVQELAQTAGRVMAGVALGVAAIEVVAAIFALCLANSIRNQDRRYA